MLSGTVDYAMYTSFREQLECAPAALAIVVRPHNEDYVFQRDHHHVGRNTSESRPKTISLVLLPRQI
jgi:hypothetical protein